MKATPQTRALTQQLRAHPAYQQWVQRQGANHFSSVNGAGQAMDWTSSANSPLRNLTQAQRADLQRTMAAAGFPMPDGLEMGPDGGLYEPTHELRNFALAAGGIAAAPFLAPLLAGGGGAASAGGGASAGAAGSISPLAPAMPGLAASAAAPAAAGAAGGIAPAAGAAGSFFSSPTFWRYGVPAIAGGVQSYVGHRDARNAREQDQTNFDRTLALQESQLDPDRERMHKARNVRSLELMLRGPSYQAPQGRYGAGYATPTWSPSAQAGQAWTTLRDDLADDLWSPTAPMPPAARRRPGRR